MEKPAPGTFLMTRPFHASRAGRLLRGAIVVLALFAPATPALAQNLLASAAAGFEEPTGAAPPPGAPDSRSADRSPALLPREPARLPAKLPGDKPAVELFPEGIEWGERPIDTAQYVEESTRVVLPPAGARGGIDEEIDRRIEARLGGIPRPRYMPATDFAPPHGLLLYREDKGKGEFPFALAVSGFLQLRWLEFARGATTWTNSAGTELPISNINAFSLNRYLLMFSGHVVDERLVYAFALFGTSNNGVNTGLAPLGLAGWRFGPEATVGIGVSMLPGSREFLDGSPWTIGVDRSMANTFFRPGASPGAAALGTLADGTLHYQAGVYNSIDAGGANVLLRRGTSMAWVGNVWWEPLGKFGLGYSDMEHHADPAIRIGTSGVSAPNTRALPVPGFNPENTIVRLSDGTPLATRGALVPGASVDSFDYRLATVDAGWKWRGVSLNAEYYFRFLDGFTFAPNDPPLPVPPSHGGFLDHGGAGYLGWAFIPRTWEVYARSSAVTGPFGTGQEYGGGINRYINKSRQGRLTLEAIHMLRNPAQNILYPYRAGYTGTAIQTQLVVAF